MGEAYKKYNQEKSSGRPFYAVLLCASHGEVCCNSGMPEVDGFQVLQAMKNDASLRQIPVIVISGLEDMHSVDRCLAAGADDFLSKPVDAAVLRARIPEVLGKNSP